MIDITVDTDGVSGDHADFLAAATSVATGGEMTDDVTITCYATTSVDDTSTTDFETISLNTGVYRLYVVPGDSNYRLRRNVSTGAVFAFGYVFGHPNNITFDGLTIIGFGHTANYQSAISFAGPRDCSIVFEGCTIETEAHASRDEVINVTIDSDTHASTEAIFVNNVIISRSSSGSSNSRVMLLGNSPNAYFYNNTFVGGNSSQVLYYAASLGDAANAVFYNNILVGLAAPGFAPGTADYNATDAAFDLGGANDRQSQTFTFVDAAGDDYHLDSDDTGALDHGTDLSADAVYPFSTDIDGDTRSGDWDIGADEYVSGGGGDPVGAPVVMAMMQANQFTGGM